MNAVFNSSYFKWKFLVQERSMNCLKTVLEVAKNLVPEITRRAAK